MADFILLYLGGVIYTLIGMVFVWYVDNDGRPYTYFEFMHNNFGLWSVYVAMVIITAMWPIVVPLPATYILIRKLRGKK